ncbi:MAG: hypothetical protein JWM33_1404 [Caulobacteraceae bacterium]|nr:hypothetical protein [Caulobacteraceae bacterium]
MTTTAAYRAMLQALPDAVLLLEHAPGREVRIMFANEAAERQFEGRALAGARLLGAVRHPGVLAAIDKALSFPVDMAVDYETPGSNPRVWRALVKSLPVDNAEPPRVLLLLSDETDTRRTERMRADFLANASHELRTPLASLAGFVETLRGHARDDPEAREKFLEIMAGQAERMGRLVNDLLSLSRIELNEHLAPSGEADLCLIAGEVEAALAPTLVKRDVRIEVASSLSRVMVRGERDQIVQVLQNLVDNAVKYSPQGENVRITIESGRTLDEILTAQAGEAVALLKPDRVEGMLYGLVSVTDKGPGMARSELPRLTERFYRAPGQRVMGTGLGLAIVKHVVNRHRGGLTVASAPGSGASFTVFIPHGDPR